MGKYPIHSDFRILSGFTSPFGKTAFVLSEKLLGGLFYSERSDSDVTVRRASIKGYKETTVKALVYEPRGLPDNSPCLIFYHGGGLVFKAAPYHYRLAREYAVKARCKVIMPDYSFMPERVFPIP